MHVKKITIPAFVVLLLAMTVWGIVNTIGENGGSPEQAEKEEPEALSLRFGHNTPENSALHQASLRFASEVNRKSQGKVVVEVFPAQQLGNDHQMVEMARNGELDILLTPTAKMSVPVPAMQYADLPFLFPSREDVYAMLDGEPGRILLSKLREIGLMGVTFWENGFKHFTGNEAFITPQAFADKKIRVMKSRIIMDQFRAFGAEPVPIDFHATRQALKDKVVDGQENPLVAIVSMGFHEVQSDLVLSEHAYLGYVFSISEKVLNSLSQEVASMLIETAKEITPWERDETRKREQKFIQTIEQAGVKIHRLTAAQRQQFASKTSHIVKVFEDVIGSDIISKTEEMLLEKYGPDPASQEQIVIGIDADLALDGKSAGLAIKRGAELAIQEINSNGGVLGKPLVLIARNHQVTASISQNNLKDFIGRDDLVGVLGGLHGELIDDSIELIQKEKLPFLIAWAASANLVDNGYEDNYIFRLSANDSRVSSFLVKTALKESQKPALIAENSTWGRSNVEMISAILKKQGVDAPLAMVYNRGQDSFDKEIRRLLDNGSDSVILVANFREGSKIIQQLSELENHLPIISHWGILGGPFFDENRHILHKVDLRFLQTADFENNERQQAKDLINAYLAAYGKSSAKQIHAATGVAQAYDLVHLLAMAIREAGSLERSKIKAALEQLPPYEGVIKRYEPAFSKTDHEAMNESDYFMARFTTTGQVVPASR
jgi:C4-dicarboxylate-binding protein DctP